MSVSLTVAKSCMMFSVVVSNDALLRIYMAISHENVSPRILICGRR